MRIIPISFASAIFRTLDYRAASLYLVVGVFLSSRLGLYGDYRYIYLALLLPTLLFLLYRKMEEGIFFFLGLFIYPLASISTQLSVPDCIQDIGNTFGDYISSLPMRNSNLAKAFLQGDKSDIPRETIQLFRKSGAAHLLALSGLHMGILYLIFDKTSSFLVRSRRARIIRYIILILSVSFYTLMVGAKPSICRAFLFITIRETYKIRNYQPLLTDTFFMALMIQLLIMPDIINSVGFQLSYLAVAGIVFIVSLTEKWVDYNKTVNYIWKACCVAISCQLMTTPLALYYFGTFPKYFLLSNLITVPLATIFISMSVGCVILSAIGLCPTQLYSLTDIMGDIVLFTLEVIGDLD